jgi:PmbA protein
MIADASPMAGRIYRRALPSRHRSEQIAPAANEFPMTDSLSPATAPQPASSRIAPPAGPGSERFPLPTAELERMAESTLRAARAGGATAAETEVSQAVGQSVTVRNGEVETIAYNRDKGIGVTVYIGQRRGHASTADFAPDAIDATVAKALAIARYTARDPAAGLADPDRLARSIPDLDLYHPWELSVEDAIAMGREAEAAALAVDRRLVNTEGSTVARGEAEFVYANSNGFCAGYRSSRHHIDCSVIGSADGAMQRDYWYTAARAAADLEPASVVGRMAGERTARRLGARQVPTQECPVLFEAPEAADLIGFFVGAVSGGALYRKSSFLPDSLGTQVFAHRISIREEPHLPRGRGSAPFDNEGVATVPRDVVRDGVLRGYFLGSYSARKLGLATTGNAGGSHNLVVEHGEDDLAALLRRMGRGLLVTEQLGQGVNPVTGDFSRGAAGFWIEGGEIAFPVEEITIAGNLKSMFRDIVAVGADVDRRSSRHTGSILIGAMTIAGA